MANWHRDVHWALIGAGYQPVSNAKARLAYQGIMRADSFEVPVLLQLDDEMVRPPSIKLLDRPGGLSKPCPHIDPDNGLCYLDPQLSRMDPLNPGGMVGACLNKAQQLLEDLISGRKDGDAEHEFPLLWFPEFSSFSTLCHGFSGPATLFKFEGKNTLHILAASENEAQEYGRTWPTGEMEIKPYRSACVLSWHRPVLPAQPWPVATAQQFLEFLAGISPALSSNARDVINLRENDSFLLVLDAPNGCVGGLFEVPTQYRGRPEFKTRRQALLHAFDKEKWPLSRMTFQKLNQEHLVQRNLGGSGLVGKKVMLIGCGTIGAFLAEMLLKIGAGINGGRLTLVDNDVLMPGNLGRHILGLRYLMQNKAAACKEYLGQPLGPTQVDAWTEDVRNLRKDMWRYDLIIDATGDEAISEWLNTFRLSQLPSRKFPPILHSWIEGPGAAGAVFLNAWPETGCYRCLKTPDGTPRFRILCPAEPNAGLVVASCAEASFVRYPVSASTQAAALALQTVIDWLREGAKRPFRHIQIDSALARASGTHNVTHQNGCRACVHQS